MKRRNFLRTSALAAAAAAATDVSLSAQQPAALDPAIARLTPRSADAPAPISEDERSERRVRAQRVMAELGIDALLVEPGPTLTYFAGVRWGRSERLFAMLLPQSGDAVFISPAFEEQRAESVIDGRFAIRAWQEDESPFALVADAMRGWNAGSGTLAVDPSARFFVAHELAAAAPSIDVEDASPVIERTRGVKTAHEIEIMRFANELTVAAFRAALKTLRAGLTQRELAGTISQAMTQLGYGGGALVLFGESSAYPHGLEEPRALRAGDTVLIDGGLSVHGYASDMTRTVVFGEPADEVRKVFDIVKRAQSAALAFAGPGRRAGEVDAVARRVIDEAGYGPDYKYFTHRLGHGIGLEGHEWPYLVRGSDVVLQPGMSFSNEPGIYQYGKFGFRLEDIMVITEGGAELLTEQQKSLDPSEF